MATKGADPWLTDATPSLADDVVGPIVAYDATTPDTARLHPVEGMVDSWARMQAHLTVKATEPDLE